MVTYYSFPGVAQLVARLTGGQEAVSSSLATRTRMYLFFLQQKPLECDASTLWGFLFYSSFTKLP